MELSIIVPAYNEEEVIEESYKRLTKVMTDEGYDYEIIFVNDGSRDKTVPILTEIAAKDSHIKVIDFARNFGHQIAVTAGMDNASGDAVVVIDCDLQDPPEVIPEMVKKWREGYEVVYGKRKKRDGETFFKKFTAKMFYRILHSLSEIDLPVDAGDFRLLDRKVVEAMRTLPEHNRYIRGMVTWVGFRQTYVEFHRKERFAGETKYSLKKMLKLASNGIYSFSGKPLKLPNIFSFLMLLSALGLIIYMLIAKLPFFGAEGIMTITMVVGGLICIALGFMGEYIYRILEETRNRPHYVIRDKINF